MFRVLTTYGLAEWHEGYTETDLIGVDVQFSDEMREDPHLPMDLCTDSASATMLLKGEDIPRRSRHIEIRLERLRLPDLRRSGCEVGCR